MRSIILLLPFDPIGSVVRVPCPSAETTKQKNISDPFWRSRGENASDWTWGNEVISLLGGLKGALLLLPVMHLTVVLWR